METEGSEGCTSLRERVTTTLSKNRKFEVRVSTPENSRLGFQVLSIDRQVSVSGSLNRSTCDVFRSEKNYKH